MRLLPGEQSEPIIHFNDGSEAAALVIHRRDDALLEADAGVHEVVERAIPGVFTRYWASSNLTG